MNLMKRKNESVSPFSLLEEFERDLGSLLGNSLRTNRTFATADFPIEVQNEKDAYIVEADLPGIEKSDIKVGLYDGVLSIRAERKKEVKENTYTEKSYGVVERSIQLAEDVKPDGIKAEFKNGLLKVRLEKTKPSKNAALEINIQ